MLGPFVGGLSPSRDTSADLFRPAYGRTLCGQTNHSGRKPMSRCIDLFIDSPAPLEELATALGTLSGLTFIGAADGSHWGVRDGEGFAELAEHDFDDDRNVVVSRYRYDLF